MEIKTQTKRTTQYKDKLINLNCFVNKDFEIGIITSKYWGEFEKREIPLIDLRIEGLNFSIPLNEFIDFLKQKLKGKHFKG